jgi:hypothetical protein
MLLAAKPPAFLWGTGGPAASMSPGQAPGLSGRFDVSDPMVNWRSKAATAQKRSVADTWLVNGTVILFGIALMLAAANLVRLTGMPGNTSNPGAESLLAP